MRPGASWVLQEGQAGLGFAIFEGSRDRLLRAPEAQTLSAQALFVGYACVASFTAASLAAERVALLRLAPEFELSLLRHAGAPASVLAGRMEACLRASAGQLVQALVARALPETMRLG